jgi:hypothetical protein
MNTTTRVLDIQNKGNAALVIIAATTVDAVSNMQVAYQEFTCFIRNAGTSQAMCRYDGWCHTIRNMIGACVSHLPALAPACRLFWE